MHQGTHPMTRASDHDTQLSARDLWAMIRRNIRVVAGTTLLAIAVTAVVTMRATPLFESQLTLRVVEEEQRGGGMLSGMKEMAGLVLPGVGGTELETEMGVLRSRKIAASVADSFALRVQVMEPRVPRHTLVRVLEAGHGRGEGVYDLTRTGPGRYAVRVHQGLRDRVLGPRKNPHLIRPPAEVRVGAPFRLADVQLVLAPADGDEPEAIRLAVQSYRAAVLNVQENLEVGTQDGGSKLVEVTFRHPDPYLAAEVPNTVARSFVRYQRSTSRSESLSTVAVLREQVASYQKQLHTAEERLKNYRESAQIISPKDQAEQQIRRLAELQVKHDAMEVQRSALASLLADVRATPASPGNPSPFRRLATFPSFIQNEAVQNLLATLTELENERDVLLVNRTAEHPQVQGFSKRIADIEGQLFRLANDYLGSLDKQIASESAKVAEFGVELSAVPAKEVEYVRLLREQELLAQVYLTLQAQLKQAEVEEAIDPDDVRIIDSALVPEEPVSPRPLVNLILASMLGMMVGLAAAVGREITDTKVRSRGDAELAAGGVPLLGSIPRIRSLQDGATTADGYARALRARITRIPAETRVRDRLVTQRAPRHPASEAYRDLRTSITFASAEGVPQLLVITSAREGDGKSVVASNLAVAFAQQGSRTLLVDGDLRRGRLHSALGVRQDPGLAHLLTGRATLEDAIQEVEVGNAGRSLFFISSGAFPQDPAELLGSLRMRELAGELRERFDFVVIDAPPLGPVADAAVLGTSADATVLVARADVTDRSALEDAVLRLRRLRVPIAGVVLNDTRDADPHSYYAMAGDESIR
jgi:tyrosine-protein kinase Etk/Wzc